MTTNKKYIVSSIDIRVHLFRLISDFLVNKSLFPHMQLDAIQPYYVSRLPMPDMCGAYILIYGKTIEHYNATFDIKYLDIENRCTGNLHLCKLFHTTQKKFMHIAYDKYKPGLYKHK